MSRKSLNLESLLKKYKHLAPSDDELVNMMDGWEDSFIKSVRLFLKNKMRKGEFLRSVCKSLKKMKGGRHFFTVLDSAKEIDRIFRFLIDVTKRVPEKMGLLMKTCICDTSSAVVNYYFCLLFGLFFRHFTERSPFFELFEPDVENRLLDYLLNNGVIKSIINLACRFPVLELHTALGASAELFYEGVNENGVSNLLFMRGTYKLLRIRVLESVFQALYFIYGRSFTRKKIMKYRNLSDLAETCTEYLLCTNSHIERKAKRAIPENQESSMKFLRESAGSVLLAISNDIYYPRVVENVMNFIRRFPGQVMNSDDFFVTQLFGCLQQMRMHLNPQERPLLSSLTFDTLRQQKKNRRGFMTQSRLLGTLSLFFKEESEELEDFMKCHPHPETTLIDLLCYQRLPNFCFSTNLQEYCIVVSSFKVIHILKVNDYFSKIQHLDIILQQPTDVNEFPQVFLSGKKSQLIETKVQDTILEREWNLEDNGYRCECMCCLKNHSTSSSTGLYKMGGDYRSLDPSVLSDENFVNKFITSSSCSGVGKKKSSFGRVMFSRCDVCKKAGDIKKCRVCKKRFYCSVLCQKKDWKNGHKNQCGLLKEKKKNKKKRKNVVVVEKKRKCVCGKNGDKTCSRCKKVFYCSILCQRSDWKIHKVNCSK